MRDCSGILNYVIGAGGQRPLVGGRVAGSPSPTTKSFPLLISDAFWLSSYLPRKGSGSVLCRVLILFGFLISIVKEF